MPVHAPLRHALPACLMLAAAFAASLACLCCPAAARQRTLSLRAFACHSASLRIMPCWSRRLPMRKSKPHDQPGARLSARFACSPLRCAPSACPRQRFCSRGALLLACKGAATRMTPLRSETWPCPLCFRHPATPASLRCRALQRQEKGRHEERKESRCEYTPAFLQKDAARAGYRPCLKGFAPL